MLGAAHTVELPFVFGVTGLPELYGEGVLGPVPAPAEAAAMAALSEHVRGV
ncbi:MULTISPECIES: hypothetical protein [Streptomyces]|uniref:hypothetical protein n=1 Tax=Streptomyces TaxID=1883 RepID=UPI001E3F1B22|nr:MULTISPECIES: hypothetical protein [Streptomyces]UFQ19875.1 hypothetical protein J2N69_35685 [Streptomyces huasconensis]WCL89498.1 hypothetical protein PPN52_35630 [Streptomyces sp. JCM 35825]